jgi:peptide chain release factor 1
MMRDSSLDPEFRDMAKEEFRECRDLLDQLMGELKILLMPRDPNDSKNVIVEIRQGAGGEEAALFGADLFRMYSMYANARRFAIQIESINETELGGIKEVVFSVKGDGAYSRFKFESGVHRVQRIPVTESNGRIQTSTVTVAVLPEADEVEVEVNMADVKIESCKSSGAGGQHINKTESAVRLTHKPTGIVIECDQERSQLQNKERALRLLYTKLYDIKQREQSEQIASTRKSQVGSGDRSEKIRTYNFPQSRVTDHRINKTIYSLDAFLNGDVDGIIDEMISADTAERLKGEGNEN